MWVALFLLGLPRFRTVGHVQTQPSPAVSIESPYISIGDLLKEVSHQSGLKFDARLDITNEHCAVRLDQVPLQTALDKISWMTYGKWIKNGNAYTLKRDQDRLNRRLAASRNQFNQYLDFQKKSLEASLLNADQEAHLESTVKLLLKADPEAYGIARRNKLSFPIGQELLRAFLAIPDDTLPMWGFNVINYSTSPTTAQRPWPLDAQSTLHSLNAEDIRWQTWSNRLDQIKTYKRVLIEKPATTLVLSIFTPGDGRPFFVYGIRAYDSTGTCVGDYISSLFYSANVLPENMPSTLSELPSNLYVTIPSEAAYFIRLERAFYGQKIPAYDDLESSLQEKILHPEAYDPLGYGWGSAFVEVMEQNHWNGLIYLAKDAVGFLAPTDIRDNSVNEKNLIQALYRNSLNRIDFELRENWLITRPVNPGYIDSHSVSRSAIGHIRRICQSTNTLDLNTYAALAASASHYAYHSYSKSIPFLFPHLKNLDTWNESDWNILGIYGSLNDQQRDQAASGGLPLDSCTQLTLHCIDNLLKESGLWNDHYADKGANFIGSEYTEAVPRGLPGGGVITFSTKRASGAFSETHNYFMSVDDIVTDLELPSTKSVAERFAAYKLVPAKQTKIAIRVTFPNAWYVEGTIPTGDDTAKINPLTLDDADNTFVKAVLAKLKQL